MGIHPDTFHCCMILHESVCVCVCVWGGGATLEPTCCNQSRVPLCVVSVRVCSTVTPEPGSNDPSVCRSPMTKRQSILCNLIQSDRKQQLDNDQHIMENWAKVQWRVTSCETKWWMIIAQILSVGKYFASPESTSAKLSIWIDRAWITFAIWRTWMSPSIHLSWPQGFIWFKRQSVHLHCIGTPLTCTVSLNTIHLAPCAPSFTSSVWYVDTVGTV